jgi:hypothetical protein
MPKGSNGKGSNGKGSNRRHGPQVKDEATYDALRERGESKEKAARIANARAAGQSPSRKGGKMPSYEDWTRDRLYDRARELGIEGRSRMAKADLVRALRNH